jgi:1-deoxy-D-xylulose-5-phosphate reductoisomerase
VLNAANEMAVEAFLERRIAFTDIHAVNCRTLDSVAASLAPPRSVADLLELDRRAREAAARHAKELAP